MENYTVSITPHHHHHFQVEQLNLESGGCAYNIYQNEILVASLEPDGHDFLRVCSNPADIDMEILHLLAEQILEQYLDKRLSQDLKSIELDSDDDMEAPPQKSPFT